MTLTHILVDFENVQPTAADIGLVRGDGLRLAIFRGPGQKKYSADVAEAWQPLGGNVTFVHCSKVGRNAVDMHIAFHLGELVAASRGGAGGHARFVIVSKDTDFDPLLLYIRAQGFEASRVSTIKAALHGGAADKAEPRAAKTRSRRGRAEAAPAPAPAPEQKPAKRAAKKAPAAAKAAAKKAPAARKEKAESLIPVPAPRAKSAARLVQAPAPRTPAARAPAARDAAAAAAPDARVKVIESLQRMGEKRPAKRKGLERHIESHLGRNLEPGQLDTLVAQLERDGLLVFNDKNKVEYRLPKAKK
jgi:hypothetical protein